MITSWVDIENAKVVAEFGPGTGSFTGQIVERLPDDAAFFGVELNEDFHKIMVERYPDVRVHCDSIASIDAILEKEGLASGSEANGGSVGMIDAIVCGLPWAAFPDELQRELLGKTFEAMAPGGRFATFAYLQGTLLPAGQRFKRLLHETFDEVSTSPIVWRNLPPAFVYQCRKNKSLEGLG